jgi:sugar-specific transcriptional regulator TrmB
MQKRCDKLSLEKIITILEGLSLKRTEAEVYVYLAKKGPQKAKDLADALKIRKRQLYSILKKLQAKGVVTASHKQTTVFSALNFENALDLLLKNNIEQAKALKKTLEERLSS